MNFKILLTAAFVVRVGMVYYGTLHDQMMEVAYTDIDYTVFTDAARHISNGKSPYLKDTYKYTPLLAFLVLPNIYWNVLFGKILFCVFDIIVAIILVHISIKSRRCSKDLAESLVTWLWLFNPFTMTISSRGNAEGIQIFLVTLTLLFLVERNVLFAGLVYGLSVHFKLYPVIYVLPIFLYIIKPLEYIRKCRTIAELAKSLFLSVLRLEVITFGVCSLASFVGVGWLMYSWYGIEFIQHTYLFHMSRKDIQHNFSPYFYILHKTDGMVIGDVINKLAFIPQLVAVALLGFVYHEKLALACFLQTFAFVAFNKVCTSQYFIWYIGLLPAAYPYMKIPLRISVKMLICWLASQGLWLFFAYLYEFRKYDVLLFVWEASLLFWLANMLLLYCFIGHVENTEQDTEYEKVGSRQEDANDRNTDLRQDTQPRNIDVARGSDEHSKGERKRSKNAGRNIDAKEKENVNAAQRKQNSKKGTKKSK